MSDTYIVEFVGGVVIVPDVIIYYTTGSSDIVTGCVEIGVGMLIYEIVGGTYALSVFPDIVIGSVEFIGIGVLLGTFTYYTTGVVICSDAIYYNYFYSYSSLDF